MAVWVGVGGVEDGALEEIVREAQKGLLCLNLKAKGGLYQCEAVTKYFSGGRNATIYSEILVI
jgi:hypothetical protein